MPEIETVEVVDCFELTSPPDQAPADDKFRRVNLFIGDRMHKRLRHYAIDHGDKTIVVTIQEIIEGFLKSEGY